MENTSKCISFKYRKKPVVIEACQISAAIHPQWYYKAFDEGVLKFKTVTVDAGDGLSPVSCSRVIVQTLEGPIFANENDYIIRGVQGELYPCKPDIFEQTYELING